MTIKFNKFNVRNTETGQTARIQYSAFTRISDNRKCVTLYAKDYNNDLKNVFVDIFDSFEDNTDLMTDYYETGKVVLFENHPTYDAALSRATVD